MCIDENGIAMVVGLNRAYFLSPWCNFPEACVAAAPLTWTNGVKVYIVVGPGSYTMAPSAAKSVSLKDWATVAGGVYNYWTASNGTLTIGQNTPTPAVCNLPTVYTFVGSGNWNLPQNWLHQSMPPSTVTGSVEIVIDPVANCECVLNISQVVAQNARISVVSGKKFIIVGNLVIQKQD
ncbi:MAG: hypothetical protein EAY75_13865 [Bacteroidetes bacterium]|nr:MAG: hypothetical protein EAY75_13865 [Bacteroidota bacterium]